MCIRDRSRIRRSSPEPRTRRGSTCCGASSHQEREGLLVLSGDAHAELPRTGDVADLDEDPVRAARQLGVDLVLIDGQPAALEKLIS